MSGPPAPVPPPCPTEPALEKTNWNIKNTPPSQSNPGPWSKSLVPSPKRSFQNQSTTGQRNFCYPQPSLAYPPPHPTSKGSPQITAPQPRPGFPCRTISIFRLLPTVGPAPASFLRMRAQGTQAGTQTPARADQLHLQTWGLSLSWAEVSICFFTAGHPGRGYKGSFSHTHTHTNTYSPFLLLPRHLSHLSGFLFLKVPC